MALRDLALTVLELEPNEYHWVLMEAMQAESEDCLGYKPIDSSIRGLPDYSEALIQGATALRVLQGLAPFGTPKSSVSMSDDEGDEEDMISVEDDGSDADEASPAHRHPPGEEVHPHHTSMLTTMASRL
jgi:hypothetical protein